MGATIHSCLMGNINIKSTRNNRMRHARYQFMPSKTLTNTTYQNAKLNTNVQFMKVLQARGHCNKAEQSINIKKSFEAFSHEDCVYWPTLVWINLVLPLLFPRLEQLLSALQTDCRKARYGFHVLYFSLKILLATQSHCQLQSVTLMWFSSKILWC